VEVAPTSNNPVYLRNLIGNTLNQNWPRIYSNQEVRVNETEMICRNIWAV